MESSALSKDTTLVHVSHARLDRKRAFSWLERGAPRGIFYVHDVIPLSYPEFVRSGEPEKHMARMETVLRYHRLVLCNSQATARALDDLAGARGFSQPCTAILPPGIDPAFLESKPDLALRTRRPYFVCIGTIEPRKNHQLLLSLWRRLFEQCRQDTPKLVIVGRRGWDNSQIFKILDRPEALGHSIIEVPDLCDRGLARLLGGASALLAPSFVEGYGMPIVEALAVGTPVIASDIRAHREIARGRASLIDPINGQGWLEAVKAHIPTRRRVDAAAGCWTWAEHFNGLYRLLGSPLRHRMTVERCDPLPADWQPQTGLRGIATC